MPLILKTKKLCNYLFLYQDDKTQFLKCVIEPMMNVIFSMINVLTHEILIMKPTTGTKLGYSENRIKRKEGIMYRKDSILHFSMHCSYLYKNKRNFFKVLILWLPTYLIDTISADTQCQNEITHKTKN